jgi:hypothetical protein
LDLAVGETTDGHSDYKKRSAATSETPGLDDLGT